MLSGEEVRLRAIEQRDLPQLLAWRNTPDLRRFFRERRELTMDDQLAWFERVAANWGCESIQQTSMLMFAIERQARSELVGACGLCYIEWVNGNAEISVYIGAGSVYIDELLAPEACNLLMSYAFEELGLRKLWVEVYAFDDRKTGLFEKLGYLQEGRLREHRLHEGVHHDSLLFGFLREERSQ